MNVKGGNRGYCSSRDQCLCRAATPVPTGQPYMASPTVVPTGTAQQISHAPTVIPTTGYPAPPRYELITSGKCAIYINSTAVCALAAAALGQDDTSVQDDGKSKSTSAPPGCYSQAVRFMGYSLKMDADGTNTGSCSAQFKCLCMAAQSPAPVTLSPAGHSNLQTGPPTAVPVSAGVVDICCVRRTVWSQIVGYVCIHSGMAC